MLESDIEIHCNNANLFLIYLANVLAQLNITFFMCGQRERWCCLWTMLNCTDTVYILLLHSGLHLLHAPFRPKINMFYGLLLLAMETKKKWALLIIIQDLIILFYRKIGKLNDKNVPSLSFKVEESSLHTSGWISSEFQVRQLF